MLDVVDIDSEICDLRVRGAESMLDISIEVTSLHSRNSVTFLSNSFFLHVDLLIDFLIRFYHLNPRSLTLL